MKKLVPALVAAVTLAGAAAASAGPIQRVDDPTPDKTFSGSYDCSYYTYDADGNATKVEKSCQQTGYVAVYDDGVVACNGNENHKRPDNQAPLQGYVWVGSAHAASNPTGAAPQNVAGAGNNSAADNKDTKDTNEAHGPCED